MTDLLLDPLFRTAFATGLPFAVALPLLGMYLRLRGEWLAALAFSQVAGAGALAASVLQIPPAAGGAAAAALAGAAKAWLAHSGDSGYAVLMLAGWALSVALVANWPAAEHLGHALFDGQLYFAGAGQMVAAWLALALVAPLLARLSRRLLAARLFPDLLAARGESAAGTGFAFDLMVAFVVALATASLGVMATFGLVFVPPWFAFRYAPGWRAGLALAVGIGVTAFCAAFAGALAFDQPFGPVCALMLAAAVLPACARRRAATVR